MTGIAFEKIKDICINVVKLIQGSFSDGFSSGFDI